jgi:cytochrome c5
MDAVLDPVEYRRGARATGVNHTAKLAPGYDYVGEFVAFNPVTGKRAWTYRSPGGEAMTGSALATAGNIVFGGTVDREFFALDSTTGKLLWRTRLGGDISGSPVTYEVDGRQYVAIAAGGKPGPSTTYAPLTGVRLSEGSAVIYVFALPDRRDLQAPGRRIGAPPVPVQKSGSQATASSGAHAEAPAPPVAAVSGGTSAGPGLFTAAQAAWGQEVFTRSCVQCHKVGEQTGPAFMAKWAGGGLGTLYRLISKTMPVNGPGKLPKSDYAAVVAYMLRESGFAPGTSEFPSAGLP